MSKSKLKKREVTRSKVIKAAIDCIYSDGFHAAHTNRIAEKAEVSWGVLLWDVRMGYTSYLASASTRFA